MKIIIIIILLVSITLNGNLWDDVYSIPMDSTIKPENIPYIPMDTTNCKIEVMDSVYFTGDIIYNDTMHSDSSFYAPYLDDTMSLHVDGYMLGPSAESIDYMTTTFTWEQYTKLIIPCDYAETLRIVGGYLKQIDDSTYLMIEK